jgi:hypothetical protein
MMDQREPTLDELLSDPIIQQVMASDGVQADDIRFLMEKATVQQGRDMDNFPAVYPQFSMHDCTASAA